MRKQEKPVRDAKAGWGLQSVPKEDGAKPDLGIAVAAPRVVEVVDADMSPDGGERDAATGKSAAPPCAGDEPGAVRRKVEVVMQEPWVDAFDKIDCGGEGDCAYLVVGKALRALQTGKRQDRYKPEDYGAAGKVQADLRLLAAKELCTNWQKYLFTNKAEATAYSAKVRKTGCYANSRSLYALA